MKPQHVGKGSASEPEYLFPPRRSARRCRRIGKAVLQTLDGFARGCYPGVAGPFRTMACRRAKLGLVSTIREADKVLAISPAMKRV